MAQTLQNIAYLLASEFQDGQLNAISAARVRDLIVSLNIPWVAFTGTSDVITAPYTYPVTTGAGPGSDWQVDGALLAGRASAANATTTPSLNPNAIGALTIKARGQQPLLIGDIPAAGYECLFRFNAASGGSYEMLNPYLDKAAAIFGTQTNDSAAAGYLGEFFRSNIAQGSAVALTTGVTANVTSLSLTAGDWDVEATLGFHPAGTTTITNLQGGITTTSATMPTTGNDGMFNENASFTTGAEQVQPISRVRISLAATTSVFLVAQSAFGVSTMGAYGTINARRVR